MTHNIVPITQLTKETLKKIKDDKNVQERMIIMKEYVQRIYVEVIKAAVNGNTSYTVLLSCISYIFFSLYWIVESGNTK